MKDNIVILEDYKKEKERILKKEQEEELDVIRKIVSEAMKDIDLPPVFFFANNVYSFNIPSADLGITEDDSWRSISDIDNWGYNEYWGDEDTE